MPLFLTDRNPELTEWMDKPDCDSELLFNTYRQFKTINKLLSGWKSIYKAHIKPVLEQTSKSVTILDIGCGGGDIIRYLDNLCKKDGHIATFTGIDPDQRSMEYLNGLDWPENITFYPTPSADLVTKNQRFDIVISNHLLHHLEPENLRSVCQDAEILASQKVLFSDIERSDIGYASFKVIAPLLFRNSYIVRDGLISIKKSYRKQELLDKLPAGWTVQRRFPFRLLAVYEQEAP